ncbi:MAG TPA: YraN family protein [Bacteroidales bacterium]|nr:YraN family protein [Bacteroidales bacterium]HPT12248.1 YraN family protein [Bacteroidales bacterium]
MSDNAETGARGEDIAAQWLRAAGYTIRDRNWRSGKTEIDIIAENDRFIVFVEVKSRAADYQVHPRDAVTVPKQRTIIFAASNYLKRYNIDKESRFDIITVVFYGSQWDVEHIEDAYYPTL